MSRRLELALIAVVQVLAISTWFSATAAAPGMAAEWSLSTLQTVWLTVGVQAGFVIGAVLAAWLGIADRIGASRLMAIGCLGAAASTGATLLVDGAIGVAILRVLTGACLAAVYPVGLKVVATWTPKSLRARAYGVLIGALTLGTALPHVIAGLDGLPWRSLMAIAGGAAAIAAALSVFGVREGPFAVPTVGRIDLGYAARMFREPGPRYANFGYFGHMWELYAFWAWAPHLAVTSGVAGSGAASALLIFAVIGLAGVAGALIGGWLADAVGRPAAAGIALATSGSCALLSPLLGLLPAPVAIAILLLWGASVIADSGVFSTALSETARSDRIGTALTAQTAVGFGLTIGSILLVGAIGESAGWQWAFLVLVPGPVFGAVAMVRLSHVLGRKRRKRLKMSNWSERMPQVGQSAELSRTILPEDIELFTRISGDMNPLHYDEPAASASRFGGIIVQGGITTAILNAVVAERLPGPGSVFLGVEWKFLAPVRPGDTITGTVTVTEVRDDKPITKIATTVTRDDGVVALEGTAVCFTEDLACVRR
ncbi:MFS transporter [Ruicaihuangia caeni]|uniref:MFS transporter n=1 Tax=Ruicaihuangia caeni TaxID=3042517 RepID=A0AAW6T456_9MICO|nr:MFS transporter [Klugiella sp. YN-L-19]MDI2097391.1 MFS transporter [Klugiella sp. YN-L-19]